MQSEYYFFLFLIFGVLGYFIVTDESVAKAFVYVTKLAENKYKGFVWWLTNSPKNPIVKYLMWRRSMEMAKRLEKYFKDKHKENDK